jgi:hypothetical protein
VIFVYYQHLSLRLVYILLKAYLLGSIELVSSVSVPKFIKIGAV